MRALSLNLLAILNDDREIILNVRENQLKFPGVRILLSVTFNVSVSFNMGRDLSLVLDENCVASWVLPVCFQFHAFTVPLSLAQILCVSSL